MMRSWRDPEHLDSFILPVNEHLRYAVIFLELFMINSLTELD